MKHIIRYRLFTIRNKLVVEYKITVDEKVFRHHNAESYVSTDIILNPIITLTMMQLPDDGISKYPRIMPKQYIGLTVAQLGLFIMELEEIINQSKTVELYTYTDGRLEINTDMQNKFTHSLILNRISIIKIHPMVVMEENVPMEGFRLEFNNEDSVQYFTINEFNVLLWGLKNINFDSLGMMLYNAYGRGNHTSIAPSNSFGGGTKFDWGEP